MRYVVDKLDVDVYYNTVKIWDSNTIKFKDIKSFILKLIWLDHTCNVFNQKYSLLCAELFVHNLLYKLNICRDRTEHTDLSLIKDMKWYEKIVYKMISIFY